ncbi:MAG: DUF1566 domain-containing protein [Candidatus Nitrotoga sp.]
MKTIKFLLVMLFSITVAACSGSDPTPTSGGAGGTVPSAPTGVQAVAGNNQVTISWNLVNGAASYKLYMDTTSGISKTTSLSNPSVMHHANVTSPFVHNTLNNNTTYYFVVTAVNAAGESVESVQVSATPIAPTPPGAPIIGTAIPGIVQANVSFTAPASNGGAVITGYTVVSNPAGGVDDNAGSTNLTHIIANLINGTAYTFTVTATNSVGTSPASAASNSVTPASRPADAPGTLNDTGQTLCYNNTAEIACASTGTHPRQDAFFGRDANTALTKIGAGAAGFDFTKVCMSGSLNCAGAASNAAAPLTTEWACTKDNHTNLIWSLETQTGTWANATTTLLTAANTATRCGFSTGWRLPTRRELLSIVHNGTSRPSIDTTYFPSTFATFYWSNDTYAPNSDKAWLVNFVIGSTQANDKTDSIQVRLVRSGQ